MENEGIVEQRKHFFEKVMNILDEAEGAKEIRDSKYGPLSFLKEKYYVRGAVVSSLGKISSISGLKKFLALNVLEIHSKKNRSKISFNQFKELVEGTAGKIYNVNYTNLDECSSVKKNREIICERLSSVYAPENMEKSIKYLQNSEELFPYLFMDKLRSVVWSELKKFFELCKQSACSNCSMKKEVYYQFIQAVTLYEIFYLSLLYEKAEEYVKKGKDILNPVSEQVLKIEKLNKEMKNNNLSLERILEIQNTVQELQYKMDDIMQEFNDNCDYLGIYQLLVMEFGSSYYAMCCLLMVFEAIQVCDSDTQLSSQIENNLQSTYGREIAVITEINSNRIKRYEEVNHEVEKLLENQYRKYDLEGNKNYNEEDAIYTFMTELCKPVRRQNKDILRGLEIVLGYPLYCQKGRKTESDEKAQKI